MFTIRADMTGKLLFVIICSLLYFCGVLCEEAAASTEREYQLNDTSAEISNRSSEYNLDSAENQPGPPDSHEAMNNRDLTQQHRRKRSFEFLVGLINNNSKYEVIRSDPEMANRKEPLRKSENRSDDATNLLLDLLTKIVTYPDHWRQIHQILRNLDQDLSSSQHILKHYQQLKQQNSKFRDSKRETDNMIVQKEWQEPTVGTTTNKWPTFDEVDESTDNKETANRKSEKSTYQKSFTYHKVTGKPTHLQKTPAAYIAVSAISPGPSESEDFLLESELHQLKPWKNKSPSNQI